MKIVYVAKHDCGLNDDEGAIAFALRQLGHEVAEVHEQESLLPPGDLLLFHKFRNLPAIHAFNGRKVFWYFDLVDFPDSELKARCDARKQWMEVVVPLVDIGFCTDGDWMERWNRETPGNKLVWLPQGADERVVGRRQAVQDIDILFVGQYKKCGEGRRNFVCDMVTRYGSRFVQVRNVYREKLRDLVARAKIVVAPNAPVTDKYWSNRVYVMLGFGAFLLHPYCDGLTSQFSAYALPMYSDREDLHLKIDYFLEAPEAREACQIAALRETQAKHLYRHRCEELIRTMKERLM